MLDAAIAPPAATELGLDAGFAWTMLPRHGRRPLGFHGRLLLDAGSRPPGLPVWSALAIHEAQQGGLVAEISHTPAGAGDAPNPDTRRYAETAADPADLLAALLAHDPLADLPATLLFEAAGDDPATARQLLRAQRAAWHALLRAALGPIPPQH